MAQSPAKPSKQSPSGISTTTPLDTVKGGPELPLHLTCLKKNAKPLNTFDGHRIDLWELSVPETGFDLGAWASSFRQQYCPDSEIDILRAGTGLSRSEYLTQLVFPDKKVAPGPAIRAGDFAELIVSDFVEYILGYWIPRGKYAEKSSRDESVKGVDILGFRASPPAVAPTDTLLTFEVKAQLSDTKYEGRLQNAIDDSSKDLLRLAITLNATKRRLLREGKQQNALVVQRFQNRSDHPYIYRSGAAAVLSDSAYDEEGLQISTKVTGHKNASNLDLVVIRGNELMKLVHSLYERAADEA